MQAIEDAQAGAALKGGLLEEVGAPQRRQRDLLGDLAQRLLFFQSRPAGVAVEPILNHSHAHGVRSFRRPLRKRRTRSEGQLATSSSIAPVSMPARALSSTRRLSTTGRADRQSSFRT